MAMSDTVMRRPAMRGLPPRTPGVISMCCVSALTVAMKASLFTVTLPHSILSFLTVQAQRVGCVHQLAPEAHLGVERQSTMGRYSVPVGVEGGLAIEIRRRPNIHRRAGGRSQTPTRPSQYPSPRPRSPAPGNLSAGPGDSPLDQAGCTTSTSHAERTVLHPGGEQASGS